MQCWKLRLPHLIVGMFPSYCVRSFRIILADRHAKVRATFRVEYRFRYRRQLIVKLVISSRQTKHLETRTWVNRKHLYAHRGDTAYMLDVRRISKLNLALMAMWYHRHSQVRGFRLELSSEK